MSRESLGTVRLHRWMCDVCGKQQENRSKASGTIPLPEGWMHVSLYVDRGAKLNQRKDADVCGGACANQFNESVLLDEEQAKEEVAAE